MREVRNLLIGFELGDEMSQMAYYDRSSREAVSLPAKVGTNVYRFPTILAENRDKGEWHYGLEASYFAGEGHAALVKHLVRRAENRQSAEINGQRYEAWELLSIFFRESLKLFGLPDIVSATRAICVTAPKLNPNLAAAIRKALREIGFSDDQFLMADASESFYYYCYSQQPQIWTRAIGLLEFSDAKVTLSFLEENRQKNPHIVRLNRKAELHLPKNDDDKDLVLAQFIKKQCGPRQISAIFITGNGFSQKWAKMSVHALAECGRRVFEGDNLFVKGACYAAAEKKEFRRMKGRVYEGRDLVRDGLTIDVIDKGALSVMPLLVPGHNWYENGASLDFILDGRREIVLTRIGTDGHSRENITLPLDGLPERPNRATRIQLTVECPSEKTCHIRAEDLGFGELFPATHRIWETEFALSEPPAEEEEPAAETEEMQTAEAEETPDVDEKSPDMPHANPEPEEDTPEKYADKTVSVHKARHFIIPDIPKDESQEEKESSEELSHSREKEPEKPVSIIPDVPLMATIRQSEEHREAEERGDYPKNDISSTKQEDRKRLDEMSGTGGTTPEERKNTLNRLFNLQIPSIQPLKSSTGNDKTSAETKERLSSKRTPYTMRFGIDFDADIPEEEEIDTDVKGGDDQ